MARFHYPPERLQYLMENFRRRCASNLSPSQHRDQVAIEFLRMNPSTMRRWCNGTLPIPPAVAMLAEVMYHHGITAVEIQRLMRGEPSTDTVTLLRHTKIQFEAARDLTGVMRHRWDVRNNLVDYCPVFRRMLGYRPDDQITRDAWHKHVHRGDHQRINKMAEEAMRGRHDGVYDYIYRLATDGGEKEIHSRGRVEFIGKEPAYFVGASCLVK
jgi:PAS domain-containing protein